MLTNKNIKRNAVHKTANYYQHGKDDYYASEGQAMGWQGKGAERLGLKGPVDPKRFKELLLGKVSPDKPSTRKFTRKDQSERLAIDFTFQAPKTVSMQALIGGDVEIIKAHDDAVAEILKEMETYAQARKKEQGKSYIENTGNLIIAKFRHETNRECEPHLHTHAVTMNLTQRSDGQWRVLHNDKLIKMVTYFDTMFLSKLAHKLERLGYELRHDPNGAFELAHITRDQAEQFSTRSGQIEAELAKQGLTRQTASHEQKQLANLKTRKAKVSVARQALFQEWVRNAKEAGVDFNPERFKTRQDYFANLPAQESARRSLRYAINHLTERQSVVSEEQLVMTALRHSMGTATFEDVSSHIERQTASGYLIRSDVLYVEVGIDGVQSQDCYSKTEWIKKAKAQGMSQRDAKSYVNDALEKGGLIPAESLYTTQTALEREQRILKIEKDGRTAVVPLMSKAVADSYLAKSSLNESQHCAAEHILTSSNRVIGVQGFAGVGKTHMLKSAKKALEAEGYQLLGLAPYGSQVTELKKLGANAKTVAGFLRTKNKQLDERTVIVVDEAGVMPTHLTEKLLKTAEQANARVVLMGDTAQTKAIEAGRPFYDLQVHGMSTAHMDQILRQQNERLKHVAIHAAQGHTGASLQSMDRRDLIEIEDPAERHIAIADTYLALPDKDREHTLIVSGTNEARRNININVRDGLGLAGKGKDYTLLVSRDTTQAERRHAKNFHVGDVIVPQKDYHNGLKRYEPYEIIENGPGNRLTVRSQDGQQITFSPSSHRKLSVFQAEKGELSVGDTIRATAKNPALDVENGERFEVTDISKDGVTVQNKSQELKLSGNKPLQFDHAYATTAHSAQGMTEDRVLIDINTKSLTTSKETYYVAVTRAKHSAKIFTNDLEQLPSSIARQTEKFAAMDIARRTKQRELEKQDLSYGRG